MVNNMFHSDHTLQTLNTILIAQIQYLLHKPVQTFDLH